MTVDNKRIVRQVYEEIRGGGQLDLVNEVFAEEYVGHDPTAIPEEVRGRQAFKDQTSHYRSAFPDLRFSVDSIVAEGDEVVVRWTATGTHRGAVVDESPTGHEVTVAGFGSWIVRDGKITEHWGIIDLMGLLRQIGAIE
jgi:steroid delta-isomerase-like uncharacterized protein